MCGGFGGNDGGGGKYGGFGGRPGANVFAYMVKVTVGSERSKLHSLKRVITSLPCQSDMKLHSLFEEHSVLASDREFVAIFVITLEVSSDRQKLHVLLFCWR